MESLLWKDELTFIHRQCCPNGWIDRSGPFTKKRPRHYQASFVLGYSLPFPSWIVKKNILKYIGFAQTKNNFWKYGRLLRDKNLKIVKQTNTDQNALRKKILPALIQIFQFGKFYDKSSWYGSRWYQLYNFWISPQIWQFGN